jgi:Type II CAAX prenyl endopeptidase Rce1-like
MCWALGCLGVLSLALQDVPAAVQGLPSLQSLPPLAVRTLLLINPLLLMTAAAWAGAATAHQVSLGSLVAGTSGRRLDFKLATAAGLGLAVLVFGIDTALLPHLGAAWQALNAQADAAPLQTKLTALTTGVFYGGLTEEVMLRWGVMSSLVWLLHRLAQRATRRAQAATRVVAPATTPPPPQTWVMGTAITLSALLFAAAHLPALAASVELSQAIIVRTIALNTVAGWIYGGLFWRRNLETAMLAHAATHVGLALARSIG